MTAEREQIDADVMTLARQLHQSADAVAPAVRMAQDSKKISGLAVSAVKLNFILAIGLLFSIIANGVLGWIAAHPVREYFATDRGVLMPIVPLSRPHRTSADVIQYTRDSLTRSFSLDFLNWRQQLEDARPYFTREGFKSFLASLQDSGVLDTVRNRRMNMTITAGTGVLTREGQESGIAVWYVELPIEVRLSGQTTELPTQRFLATVRIERVSTHDSIGGIGIGQLVTVPR